VLPLTLIERTIMDEKHVIPNQVGPVAKKIQETFNLSEEDVWNVITITTLSFKKDVFSVSDLLNESIAFCKRIGLNGK
jgi:hypothetical protein